VVRGIVRRARILEQADWQQPLYEIADRLGLDEAPQLVQSHRIKMPFATGFLKAVIVLPTESAAWSYERRCAVLIHELAHVKRRDLVGHLVGGIACALYWFHPLVWKAAWHLRAESERACDDLALVLGTPPLDYAEHLLEIVTQVRDEHMPAVALAMAKPREFEGRMLAILDPRHYRRAPSRAQTAWLVGSLTALALVVGAVSPARRVTASPPAPAVDGTTASLVLEDESATSESVKLDEASAQVKQRTQARQESQSKQSAQAQDDGASTVSNASTGSDAAPSTQASHRIQVLAKSLRTDSDAEVRRVAAWGLSRYAGNEVAAKALAEAVMGDENAEVREMATWALSGSRTSAAITALEDALRDKNPEIRRTAVWATGSVGSRSSVEGLTRLLSDPDVTAWAIGSCSPELAPAALVRTLGDADRDVRLAAAWALYAIADPNTSDEIESAFRGEKDQEVQRGLIRALGSMGERSIATLTRLVDSSDPEIRAVAVAALAGGNISGPWPWPRPEPRPYP
jgi:HEAT repeat protein